jgi:hypothetical protein
LNSMTTPEIIERLDRIESLLSKIAKALHIDEPPRRSMAEIDKFVDEAVRDFQKRDVAKKKRAAAKKRSGNPKQP